MCLPNIASPYTGAQESGPAYHNTLLSSLFNVTLFSARNSCTCILRLQVYDFSFLFHFSCCDKDVTDEKYGKHVRLCIILYIKLKGGLFVCLFVCTLYKYTFLNRSESNFAHISAFVWKRP
jgi:hypothetical protein